MSQHTKFLAGIAALAVLGVAVASLFLVNRGGETGEVATDETGDMAAVVETDAASADTGTDVSGTDEPADTGTTAAETADDGASLPAEPIEDDSFPEPDENGITTINWDDLLPEGEMDRIEELFRAAYSLNEMSHFGGPMPQIGTFNVEERLIGRTIRMPGYILPLNLQPGGELSEFLLVPYFGACVHTPPPPPNQIIYVRTGEPITVDELWAPVWVTGVLSSESFFADLGDAAYTLELTAHEPYQYER